MKGELHIWRVSLWRLSFWRASSSARFSLARFHFGAFLFGAFPNFVRTYDDPVSRFECISGLRVYPVEIRSVNNLSSSEDCSTDYCQPV